MRRLFFHVAPSAVLWPAILLPGSAPTVRPSRPWVAAGDVVAIAPVNKTDTLPDSLPAQLATITTDTGAFAPGHRDFSRYDTPGLCRAAARVTRDRFTMSLEAQVVGDTLSEDTIGVGGTAPVARACGARFTLANTVARDHNDLFDLALQEQDDALAQAVLTKIVAQETTEAEKEDSWASALGWYLDFGRVAAAETLMAQVDADSAVAPSTLLNMHYRLGRYYDRDGDTARFRGEITRALAVEQHDNHRAYLTAVTAFQDLMRLAAESHPDSLPAVAQQAKEYLRTYTIEEQRKGDPLHHTIDEWGELPLDSVIDHLAPAWYTYRLLGGAVLAPRLQAAYWFPAPGHPADDTIVPVRGKINLLCMGGEETDDWWDVFSQNPLYSAYQQAAHLRSWLTQYGAAGLEVTLVRIASGHAGYDVQTPAEEAREWRWLAQEYEELPVRVAVQVQQTASWLPPPDGRRYTEKKVQFNAFWQHDPDYMRDTVGYGAGNDSVHGLRPAEDPGSCTVIGRDGAILYTEEGGKKIFDGPRNNVAILLKWLFQGPGASVASASLTSAVPQASPSADVAPPPRRGTAP